MSLKVRAKDIFRATLADNCGNTGYLGFAPDGGSYHVVVPVDAQLARGLKPGLRPDDGTPFGGYCGWRYFCCPPYPSGRPGAREAQVEANARALLAWAAEEGLDLEIKE